MRKGRVTIPTDENYVEGMKNSRFLPYFFPDTFFEGNDESAIAAGEVVWKKA